jgi:hypothetical protein
MPRFPSEFSEQITILLLRLDTGTVGGTLLEIRRRDVSSSWHREWEWRAQAHKDLEWFRPPERNTIRPLFLYCSRKSLKYRVWESLTVWVCCLRRAWGLELEKLEEACLSKRLDLESSQVLGSLYLNGNALLGRWSCPWLKVWSSRRPGLGPLVGLRHTSAYHAVRLDPSAGQSWTRERIWHVAHTWRQPTPRHNIMAHVGPGALPGQVQDDSLA